MGLWHLHSRLGRIGPDFHLRKGTLDHTSRQLATLLVIVMKTISQMYLILILTLLTDMKRNLPALTCGFNNDTMENLELILFVILIQTERKKITKSKRGRTDAGHDVAILVVAVQRAWND